MVCLLLREQLRRETATANALIPYVIQQGSKKYPTISQLTAVTERSYGSVFEVDTIKKGEEQILQFYMEFIGNRGLLRESLEFLAEVMFNPLVENGGFKQKYVDLAKANAKISMESRVNNKAEYAKLRCIEKMCAKEPFSIYGDGYPEDLEKLTAAETYERYMDLVQKAPGEIYVVGNEDNEEVEALVKEIFSRETAQDMEPKPPEVVYSPGKERVVKESMEITQGKVCIGLRSGVGSSHEEFYDLMVANEILGGGPGSKLFANARERESLCYYISSQLFRSKGIVMVQSGTDQGNFERLLSLIRDQLGSMSQGKVTEEEISGAKKSLVKKYLSICDYPAGIVDFHFSQRASGDEAGIDEVVKKIEAVSKKNVCGMAERLYMDTVYLLGNFNREKLQHV